MASIFTKIINGEIPCHKVLEDEHFIAFMDIMPVAKGHTLVVPKEEVNKIFDNSDETLAKLMPFCKKVAKAIESVYPCDRVGVSVIGLEVPHTHVHLIPINHLGDMDFTKPKLKLSQEELAEHASRIRGRLVGSGK